MKKILLLLMSLFFISVLTFGQKYKKTQKADRIGEFKNRMDLSTSNDPLAVLTFDVPKLKELIPQKSFITRSTKTKHLKSTSLTKALVDTAYTFAWIPSIQQWDTVPNGKTVYSYDNQGNLTKYLSFTWNSAAKSWQSTAQVINTYNASNQLANVLQQNWKNRGRSGYSWVNNYQNILLYDSLNRESNFMFQTWDASKNKWISSWQHQFNYDSIGNNVNILEKDWSSADNNWVLGYNYVNQFDSVKHVTSNLIQIWYNSAWTNSAQSIYSYDINGNKTSMLNQAWNYDLGLFENSELDSLFYSSSNKIDFYLIRLWDTYISDWYLLQQAVYKYDSVGNNTTVSNQDYDPYSNVWDINTENLYEFDAQNTQFSSALLYWSASTKNWYKGTKTKQIIASSSVTKKQKIGVQEVDRNSSGTTIEVYPNPASEIVNIQNNANINQVKMFDMLGNEVLLKQYTGSTNIQLDVTNLKSGVYILLIKNSDGTSGTKRLVKK